MREHEEKVIDVVYLTSSRHNYYKHEELRFSLRSLEKHIRGYRDVYLVGIRPAWVDKVKFLARDDPYTKNKDANIIHKTLESCRYQSISDTFLFVNDDHFFTRDCVAAEFPYYHKGELKSGSPNPGYVRRIRYTREQLVKRKLPTLNYDLHTPLLINKKLFLEIFQNWEELWKTEIGPGIVMKSVYCNSAGVDGILLDDCKLSPAHRLSLNKLEELVRSRPCFSVTNRLNEPIFKLLNKLYPKPSRYEKC